MYRLIVTLPPKEETLVRHAADSHGMSMNDVVRQLINTLEPPGGPADKAREALRAKMRGRRGKVSIVPPADGLGFNQINVRTPKRAGESEEDAAFRRTWERNNPGLKWPGNEGP